MNPDPFYIRLLLFALAITMCPLWAEEKPAAVEVPSKEETWGVIPLLVPLYTPETRFMVAGGGIFWYNPWPTAPRKRITELQTFFTASQNQQYSFGLVAEAYFLQHRLKVMQNLDIYRQPNLFWGLGPYVPASNEDRYDARGVANRTSVLWLVAENIYLGGMWQSQFDTIESASPTSYLNTVKPTGHTRTRGNGPGVHLVIDTRDNPFSPEKGQWLEMRLTWSDAIFGGSGVFAQSVFDLRHFQKIWFGHVLAFNALLATSSGDTPWLAMPRLGGQFLMRGFFYGRYIDNHLWVTQVDYRLPIWWRFGLVLFSGIGDVTSDLAAPLSTNYKIGYGAGLRVLVDKEQKINMRLDMGFTNHGDANFYFTFKEAF